MAQLGEALVTRDPVATDLGMIVRPIGGINVMTGTFTGAAVAPSSGTHSVVTDPTASVTFQAENSLRKGWNCYNNSNNQIFLFLGSGASPSKFSVVLPSASYYELPFPVYTGIITGVWANSGSTAGDAQVDELI